MLNCGEEIEPDITDYLLLSKKQELPAAGVLGVSLEEKDGECRIRSLNPAGAAEKAGVHRGDVLVEIEGQPIKTIADVHLALWDKEPGDRVRISVRQRSLLRAARRRDFEVDLAAPSEPPGNP